MRKVCPNLYLALSHLADLNAVVPSLVTSLSTEQIDTLGDRFLDELVHRGAYYRIRCVWGKRKVEDVAYSIAL